MTHAPKRVWARPSVTPLTNPDSRSDAPDVAARNGNLSLSEPPDGPA
ncbi:MAG: hypothetical protein U5K29_15525 [Acidimicrobiales bacterium]|nr:hypothetical protein [Acidimicrobiales bacterium]